MILFTKIGKSILALVILWFRNGAKMASRFAATSKDEGLKILKAAVATNTMRATNFDFSVFTGS